MDESSFEKDLAQRLITKMDKRSDGSVHFDDFCTVYLALEEKMADSVSQLFSNKLKLEDDIDYYTDKLEEAKKREVKTSKGIMKGSVLSVQILEIQYFDLNKSTGRSSLWLKLSLGSQLYSSKPLPLNLRLQDSNKYSL